jgi:hypothetical protein
LEQAAILLLPYYSIAVLYRAVFSCLENLIATSNYFWIKVKIALEGKTLKDYVIELIKADLEKSQK